MKVLIVCPYSWSTPGGVGAHVANLAAALRVRGHEVRVLAPSEEDPEPGVVSVGRSIPIPYNGSVARLAFGPRVAGRIRVALRRARPDVVHVHEPFAPSVGLLTLLNTRKPVVATFHASISRSRAYRVAAPALRPLYRRLAARIAVSGEAKHTVEKVFGPGDMRVIPNGVDWSRFSTLPPPEGSLILFLGRMERRKGAAVALDAFIRLRERVPSAEILFVGEGPERGTVEAAVPEDLHDAVLFAGRVDQAELPEIFRRSAVVCVPSLGGESFGIVLLEAMSAGRPVVASSIPGYAAVARNGVDAILVPPGDAGALADALATVLGDPERARAMGEAGRTHARRYDWPTVAAEIEQVYGEALETAPRGRRRKPR